MEKKKKNHSKFFLQFSLFLSNERVEKKDSKKKQVGFKKKTFPFKYEGCRGKKESISLHRQEPINGFEQISH